MQHIVYGGEVFEFDYTILNNEEKIIFFKYNSRKRLKKELRSVFNTNSMTIIENRLKKYNLKLVFIIRGSSFEYYEIITDNIYGGSIKMNNTKGMKIRFNLDNINNEKGE